MRDMDYAYIHQSIATRWPARVSCFMQGIAGLSVKDRALSGRTTG